MFKKVVTTLIMFFVFLAGAFASTESEVWLQAAKFLAMKGIIKQVTQDADFRLQDTITRKEVMKIVVNLAGGNATDADCPDDFKETFSDVDRNDWGCKYIGWAYSQGYIVGKIVGGHQVSIPFRPNDNITKSEAVKLILKARGITKIYNTNNWQEDYAKTAADLGLVEIYTDYNSDAQRGWIFSLAANDFKEYKNMHPSIVSDEAL